MFHIPCLPDIFNIHSVSHSPNHLCSKTSVPSAGLMLPKWHSQDTTPLAHKLAVDDFLGLPLWITCHLLSSLAIFFFKLTYSLKSPQLFVFFLSPYFHQHRHPPLSRYQLVLSSGIPNIHKTHEDFTTSNF